MNIMPNATLWSGLVEAQGRKDNCFGDIKYVRVDAAVFAQTEQEAIDLWQRGLLGMGFDLLRILQAVPVADNEYGRIFDIARATGLPEFGNFRVCDNSYDDEESDKPDSTEIIEIEAVSTVTLWTGLVEVRGRPDGDNPEISGAFSRAAVLAETEEQAIGLWRRGLLSNGFDFLHVMELERVDPDDRSWLYELARRTRLPQFGSFNSFPQDENPEDVEDDDKSV